MEKKVMALIEEAFYNAAPEEGSQSIRVDIDSDHLDEVGLDNFYNSLVDEYSGFEYEIVHEVEFLDDMESYRTFEPVYVEELQEFSYVVENFEVDFNYIEVEVYCTIK